MGRSENLTLCIDRPIANPVVVFKAGNGDWAILFNPDTADAVGINQVGVVMWGLMDGRHSLQDILGAVKGRFADVPVSAVEDVAVFVDDLAARGFVGYEVERGGRVELPSPQPSPCQGEGAGRLLQPLKDAVGLIGPESPWPLRVERRPGAPLFFAHRGSSMNPTLHESDLLEIVPYGDRAAQVGDVIALAPPDADHLVVHRVVRVMPEGVCTRGDNNAGEDGWRLESERVIGRVVAAWRGRRRRRIFGGWAGRLWGYALRGRRILGRAALALLRPVYHGLARSGIVRRLVPGFKFRVLVFRAGERRWLRLMLGRRIVGEYVPSWRKWRFRRPFRLLVDEAALPQALPMVFELEEGADDWKERLDELQGSF